MSTSKNLKLAIWLGGLLAPGLLISASVPSVAADETLKLNKAVTLPLLSNGSQSVLRSFDISFVDPDSHTYALAASALFPSGRGPASHPGVVTVDTQTKIAKILAEGQFAGSCSIPPARDTFSGPDGLIIIHNGPNTEIWVGDGPIFNTSCNPASGVKTASNVKVLDLQTGAIKKTISTGGHRRADELCYNPAQGVVLIANPDEGDVMLAPFITFIDAKSYTVLDTIKFDGTDARADNINAIGGIEQCQYTGGKFYLSLPNIGGGPAHNEGAVVRISAVPNGKFNVEKAFPIAASTGCLGPQGLAAGAADQLALGCGGTNSLIISKGSGNTIAVVTGQGGADEAWYNPGSNHYYFARSTAGVLGVWDAGPQPQADSQTPTAVGSHSVAADPNKNLFSKQSQVYVPIRSNIFGVATVCASAPGGGFNNLGCIAVYDSPSDADD